MQLVTIDDIRAAADRIRGSVVRTPLLSAPWGDPARPLWIKPESLQAIGAFKVRGAFNAIGRLDEASRARGVVAYSSGNHAQAVAYAAAAFGIGATIVMPEETPGVKVAATRSHGAEVVLCAAGQREKVADEVVARTGGVLVPPFDHPDIIAGQGTIGLEIADDLPDVATDTAQGLAAGHRVDWPIGERNRTIADGLRSQPSELTFAHLQRVLDDVITVSENDIREAVREIGLRAHLVSEPSGAVALAGYRTARTPPGPTVTILSGGNVEPDLLVQIFAGQS